MLLLAILAASIAAFLLSSVAGGGAGLILMPMLALLVPAAQAPAALTIGTATSAVSRIALFRRRIRWDVVRWFLPGALPATALGAALLSRFEPVYVQLLLGLFLVANMPALFARRETETKVAPVRPGGLLMLGAATGLVSGFTGAVGLAFNRFYYRMGLTKEEIVATRATNEVLLHLLKLALYGAFGLLTPQAVYAGLVVAAGAILASFCTPWMLARIRETLFRRIGIAAMVVAGISMTTAASAQVMARHQIGIAFSVEPHEVELATHWRARRYSAEFDRIDGLVLEHHVDPARMSPALRARVATVVGDGRLISIQKTLRLGGRDWEIEHARSGRIWETHIPRADDES